MRRIPLLSMALLATLQANDPPTMGIHEIRVGMKGYGRTVFQGSKIERFNFEVLGIQRQMAPGHGVIWVRAEGGPLEKTAILHGMSGSPCYIDGKLIGALALAQDGQKDTVAGITPIATMLEQLRDVPDAPALRTPLLLPKLEPPKVLKAAYTGQMIPLSELLGSSSIPGASTLPMPVSGTPLNPEAMAFFGGTPFTFMGSASASGSSQGMEASPVEPGGMVCVQLVQGDLDYSVSGTITYVSGKRVMLFGHQLMNLGPVDLPLWSANVVASIGSYVSSVKMTVPVAPIGAVRLDRYSGVGGILGAEPRMVPLRVGLNLGGKKTLNFRFELMDHPLLTPNLAASVVAQTLSSHIRGLGLQSLALQGNIKVANQNPINLEFMAADAHAGRLANYVGSHLQAITLNPFERPVLEGISLTIKAEERLDLTLIAGLRTLKPRVKRGEVLPVVVTLQDLQGVREVTSLNVQVPYSARPGIATLLVGDGMSLAGTDPDERSVDVNSLNDITRLLNAALRNNHAYALLVQAQPGAGLRGARIEGVPPTISSLLVADGDSKNNRLVRRVVGRALLPLEREVRGLMSLDVEVE